MQKIAGVLLFLAGTTILMGIVTAEIFYPGYSVFQNMISALGSSPPPHSVIRQPSATIFDNSMIVSGIMILAGAYFLQKAHQKKNITIPTAFLGLGVFGAGIFPAFHVIAHPTAALITFVAGGVAAILSGRSTSAPFRYIAIGLGFVILAVLFFGLILGKFIVPLLGPGGTERWVAYPIILWLVVFGGYLMNGNLLTKPKKK